MCTNVRCSIGRSDLTRINLALVAVYNQPDLGWIRQSGSSLEKKNFLLKFFYLVGATQADTCPKFLLKGSPSNFMKKNSDNLFPISIIYFVVFFFFPEKKCHGFVCLYSVVLMSMTPKPMKPLSLSKGFNGFERNFWEWEISIKLLNSVYTIIFFNIFSQFFTAMYLTRLPCGSLLNYIHEHEKDIIHN